MDEFSFVVKDAWRAAWPGAAVGVLVMRGVNNPPRHPALDEMKAAVEADLRRCFAGMDRPALRASPRIAAYDAYYRRFDKTYHVLLQLESLVHKGKDIPSVVALVECMFMAELKNQMLTAGHDLAAIRPPVRLDVAVEGETMLRSDGRECALKAGDMLMADTEGVMTAVLHGADGRTRLMPATTDAFFAVYAPPGVGEEAVHAHLLDIRDYVRLVSPDAEVERLEVHVA